MKHVPAFRPPTDASDFRSLMTRFPSGVAVITSVARGSGPRGMTCSSLTSVCLDPPTLMVALGTESATYAAIRERRAFAVNLLDDRSQATAELFSSSSARKFLEVSWESSAAGLPWLTAGVIATADCTVVRTVELGDHTAAFATVRHVSVVNGRPLLYGLRSYAKWQPQNRRPVSEDPPETQQATPTGGQRP